MSTTKELRINYDLPFALASFGATLLRLGIAFYVAVSFLLSYSYFKGLAVVGILAIMILDHLDGVLFRRSQLNTIKHWRVTRRVLDSVIDRVVIQAVCLSILISDSAFLPFYLVITVREILLSNYLTQQFLQGLLVYPGKIAKVACVSIGVTVIAYLVSFDTTPYFLLLMILLSISAFVEYRKTITNFKKNSQSSELGVGCELV